MEGFRSIHQDHTITDASKVCIETPPPPPPPSSQNAITTLMGYASLYIPAVFPPRSRNAELRKSREQINRYSNATNMHAFIV